MSLSPSFYLSLSCISVSVCLSVLHLIVAVVQQHQVSTFCHMPAILMQQQMRRKIIHEQDCLHEQALVKIVVVVVVVQQQTSDLHFCHMPAILLQQENSQKKEKEKEKDDESQDLNSMISQTTAQIWKNPSQDWHL